MYTPAASEYSLRAMRMSARISAASRGDSEENGFGEVAEFCDAEFTVVSLILVGVCCANAGQATTKTSGIAKRVTRLIARLLFFRAPKPTAVVSDCPEAFCLTQRYQKSCPEAPFSFRRRGSLEAGSAGHREPRVWDRAWLAGRVDWQRPRAGAAGCRPCRKDGRANWREW